MGELYSDQQMEAATGLPQIHVRRLIAWGAVRPAKGGKGVIRQWDRSAIRHVACVKALYAAGLSLPLAHTLRMLTPAEFLIDIIDPDAVVSAAAKRRWFNPQRPLRMMEPSDTIIRIVDGYSIFWTLGKEKSRLVGKLSADRSTFYSALDYSKFDDCNPASLSWEHHPELAEDEAQTAPAESLLHPVSISEINLGLAVRIAMRRLLKIPVFFARPAKPDQRHPHVRPRTGRK